MKRMGKGGQGLPLTTIVIAILVVVVLIVLVAFFLGGSTQITDTIKRVFFGTTAGYDLNLAIQTCQSRCDSARDLPALSRPKHAYCTSSLAVDYNPVDGEADFVKVNNKKRTVKYYCPPQGYYTNAPTQYQPGGTGQVGFLDISCELEETFQCERPSGFGSTMVGPPLPPPGA